MKLYLLRPIKQWEPWYDKCFGMVIRAESELQARTVAMLYAGDEGDKYSSSVIHEVWLDPLLTSCEVLTHEGKAGLVIRDFASA